ncbi:MAG: DUF5615 family PIN-like protein [Actinobacteria bacterium]|nr:DUF5615 family PIN-like protein [Actinomycetota bacterium]
MNFIIDMNLNPQWVPWLTGEGHEAQHWSEVGPGDAPDETIIRYAKTNSCVILTHDLDFGIILAIGGLDAPSVIQLRAQAVRPSDMGEQLLAAIQAASAYLVSGALVTVTKDRHRVTVLPIRRES